MKRSGNLKSINEISIDVKAKKLAGGPMLSGGLSPIRENKERTGSLKQEIKRNAFEQKFPSQLEVKNNSGMSHSASDSKLNTLSTKKTKAQLMAEKRTSVSAITSMEVDHSVWLDIPMVAQMGVSHRMSTLYQNAKNQSQLALNAGETPNLQIQTMIEFYEESTWTKTLMWNVFQGLIHSLMFGWAIGVLNIPQSDMEIHFGVSSSAFSWLNAIFCIGCIPGSFFGGWFSDRWGRKSFFLFNDVIWILCGIGFYFLDDFNAYLVLRFVIGFASGGTSCVTPTYLGEIAPTPIRGTIGACNQVCVCAGILFSQFIARDIWVSDWKILLMLNGSLPVLQLVVFMTFHESPAWYMLKDDDDNAEKVLMALREREDVDFEMRILEGGVEKIAIASRASINSDGGKAPLLAFPDDKPKGFREKLKTDVALKKGLYISIFLLVAQQWSGINGVFFYSAATFKDAGVNKWLGTVLASSANLFGVFLALGLVEKLGRKVCLQISGIMMIGSAGMAIVGLQINNGDFWHWFTIVSLMLYVIGFELGFGPIPWTLAAELIPSSDLSTVQGIAGAANGLANSVIALTFPAMQKGMKAFVYTPFIGVIFVAIGFVTLYVPETKGLRVEQVRQILTGEKTEQEVRIKNQIHLQAA